MSDDGVVVLPSVIKEGGGLYRSLLPLGYERLCSCAPKAINCLTRKEWAKCQVGVWRFSYEARDIRDKAVHPAMFPIALAKKVISLFTHEGELVVDPFVGSGTTLVAARDLNRNAVGFDLQGRYIDLCGERLGAGDLFNSSRQVAVQDDARNIPMYVRPETVSLIWTSPPYANILTKRRYNLSRRNPYNEQYGKVEQYSDDPRDLGTLSAEEYIVAMGDIFEALLPLVKPLGHCVINVLDIWWEGRRITLHIDLVQELRRRGYEFRNTIIWDKTNIMNRIGIFGWPSNYIAMAGMFEYLLHFWKPLA